MHCLTDLRRPGRAERLRRRCGAGAMLPVAVLGLALGLGTATAQTGSGALELTADHAELDNARGVSTYTGNVVLTRGTLRITGDIMRVFTGDDRQLDHIVVEGDPATYRDLPEGEAQAVKAEAPRMEYYAGGPERIRLLQGAVLWQGDNEFHGQTVVYDITRDRVEAESGSGKDQRIRVVIHPNRDSATQ